MLELQFLVIILLAIAILSPSENPQISQQYWQQQTAVAAVAISSNS
jgi:hypothetical protein